MKVLVVIPAFLLLHATVSGQSSNNTRTVYGRLGEDLLLPCYDGDRHGSPPPLYTRWTKDGQDIMKRDHSATAPASQLPGQQHHSILNGGTLWIRVLTVADEGTYLCNASVIDNSTAATAAAAQTPVQLQVVGGPSNISASISPAAALPNGTLFVRRGAAVSLHCEATSRPSQNLSWSFRGGNGSESLLASGAGSSLDFRIEDVQPDAQGEYLCTARNSLSQLNATWSSTLLVYYTPDRHPECMWKLDENPAHVHFVCSWPGAYPAPTLRWGENHPDPGHHSLDGHLYTSEHNDSVSLVLNRTGLFDGMTLKCEAEHPVLDPNHPNSCLFELKPPFPEGSPMVTALEGTNKTLICTEVHSLPKANTTWTRTTKQIAIVSGSKYVLSGPPDGPVYKLTIVNVTKEDEGPYFCHSENPLALIDLEVYLTVKTSASYSGAIIGIFLAALIVGAGVIIAKTLYSRRDRICLGNIFGPVEDDGGDVLSLVESDEEEIFRDAVPRLPPLSLTANGNHTTLVQIHRIPSSENEDMTEVPESSPRRHENTVPSLTEDTEYTEEPADLVTF